MFFSRPIQWYHSHADLILPDGTFKVDLSTLNSISEVYFFWEIVISYICFPEVRPETNFLTDNTETCLVQFCHCRMYSIGKLPGLSLIEEMSYTDL